MSLLPASGGPMDGARHMARPRQRWRQPDEGLLADLVGRISLRRHAQDRLLLPAGERRESERHPRSP